MILAATRKAMQTKPTALPSRCSQVVVDRILSRATPPPAYNHSMSIIRTHMNHGGSFEGAPPAQHGPRQSLQLGLDASKASQNILRLLESTHGVNNYSAQYQDTLDPCWHASGLRLGLNSENSKWIILDQEPAGGRLNWIPTISWLQFSDDRTALARLQAMDGTHRYLSMLKIDQIAPTASSMVANDGWVIVREVVSSNVDDATSASKVDDMISIAQCLQDYLNIEHGGGQEDFEQANDLFTSQACLLTVGSAVSNQERTAWSAPVGTFLEISRDTYLEGVKNQTPHDATSRRKDEIVQIDIMPGGAAAATVKVGNGAKTMLFVDHLLMGKEEGSWKILSKTFSPQFWED